MRSHIKIIIVVRVVLCATPFTDKYRYISRYLFTSIFIRNCREVSINF